jgi:L-alanine-DL-glutamate epimerase-like enolase superfamily enzyme
VIGKAIGVVVHPRRDSHALLECILRWAERHSCEVRGLHEARDLLLRGGVDVIQPDVVLAGGIGGCRRIAALADLHGRAWSPHTWSNGAGLLANLHAALGFSTCPWIEVPFDPPAWSAERRDWLLPAPLEIAPDGTIRPPDGPGLGVEPDLDALERYRIA